MPMNVKTFKLIRAIIVVFITVLILFSVSLNSYLLALISIFTGMVFLVLARSTTKVLMDEREKLIREKASQLTYAIFAPTIGIGAFILLIPYQKISPVFSKGEFIYLESLGTVLAYLALYMIFVYAVSYFFLNKKYGGGNNGK